MLGDRCRWRRSLGAPFSRHQLGVGRRDRFLGDPPRLNDLIEGAVTMELYWFPKPSVNTGTGLVEQAGILHVSAPPGNENADQRLTAEARAATRLWCCRWHDRPMASGDEGEAEGFRAHVPPTSSTCRWADCCDHRRLWPGWCAGAQPPPAAARGPGDRGGLGRSRRPAGLLRQEPGAAGSGLSLSPSGGQEKSLLAVRVAHWVTVTFSFAGQRGQAAASSWPRRNGLALQASIFGRRESGAGGPDGSHDRVGSPGRGSVHAHGSAYMTEVGGHALQERRGCRGEESPARRTVSNIEPPPGAAGAPDTAGCASSSPCSGCTARRRRRPFLALAGAVKVL